jgi:hypothetical protein
MSANTLHQPVSGADVEVSPTRNLRNVCHVFNHGTQEEGSLARAHQDRRNRQEDLAAMHLSTEVPQLHPA